MIFVRIGMTVFLLSPVLANMVWPSLFLVGRLWSIPIILISLIIEFIFLVRITGLVGSRAVWAVSSMNLASMVLGILLIPVSGLAWEFVAGQFIWACTGLGSFSWPGWTATIILAALANAAIEMPVVVYFFKQPMGRRGFGWLFVANLVTVGIAAGSFLIFPMEGGQ